MVYTMSEILEYANYDGQLAKIQTGCDLIIESAIERNVQDVSIVVF